MKKGKNWVFKETWWAIKYFICKWSTLRQIIVVLISHFNLVFQASSITEPNLSMLFMLDDLDLSHDGLVHTWPFDWRFERGALQVIWQHMCGYRINSAEMNPLTCRSAFLFCWPSHFTRLCCPLLWNMLFVSRQSRSFDKFFILLLLIKYIYFTAKMFKNILPRPWKVSLDVKSNHYWIMSVTNSIITNIHLVFISV